MLAPYFFQHGARAPVAPVKLASLVFVSCGHSYILANMFYQLVVIRASQPTCSTLTGTELLLRCQWLTLNQMTVCISDIYGMQCADTAALPVMQGEKVIARHVCRRTLECDQQDANGLIKHDFGCGLL